MKKALIIVIVLALVAIGAYSYWTRPVVPANEAGSPAAANQVRADKAKGETAYGISQDDSTATFTIQEELNGKPFTVIGKTNKISGAIVITDKDGTAPKVDISTITVDARTFATDSSQRDGAINRMILETGTPGNEYAIISDLKVTGLPTDIMPGSQFSFDATGMVTLAGIKKPAQFSGSATVLEDKLVGSIKATLKRSDFDLVIPNIPFVANVPDEFEVNATIVAKKVE